MSYGRFFNVSKSSDIDAIYVLEENYNTSSFENIFPEALGFTREQLDLFYDRASIFTSAKEINELDILSQKFTTQEGIPVSVHFMPQSIFKKMLNTSDEVMSKQHLVFFSDYKIGNFPHKYLKQVSVSQNPIKIEINKEGFYDGRDGMIAQILGYGCVSNEYVPGMYLNLILPELEIPAFDRHGDITQLINDYGEFVKKLMKKSGTENFYQIHTRVDSFATYKINEQIYYE
ncbi:MAG: hypothetical protein OHK0017_09290 [Patescibacteria group bacterium]